MKNVVFCLTVLLASTSQSVAGQVGAGPKLRVAVMDLREDAFAATDEYGPTSTTSTIQIPPPEGFALGLTEMLTTALAETGRFVVLERTELQEVFDEQELGASGSPVVPGLLLITRDLNSHWQRLRGPRRGRSDDPVEPAEPTTLGLRATPDR